MVRHNTIKTLPIQCHSGSLSEKRGCFNIKSAGMKLSHSYLKKWRQTQ